MNGLKFSIITPSYNQGNFIEETICSILNQGYRNFEYFVIDGGSTDDSVSIIRKYDSQISYWVSEKDRGQSEAINKGLERITGDVIIWINSDDLLEMNALENVANYFSENPSVDVIHGSTLLFQGASQLIRGADNLQLPEQYLSGMAFPQPSAFIRVSALRKYHPRLDETLHYGMDCDLFSSLYLNCSFLSVPDVFSKYRLHATSKTMNTNEGFAKDWQRVFCKVISSIPETQEIQDYLKRLGMWHNNEEKFPCSKSFSQDFILKSFKYFLDFQINFYYRDLHLDRVKQIAQFIKFRFPDMYIGRSIKRLHIMSRIPFARYLIILFRKPIF